MKEVYYIKSVRYQQENLLCALKKAIHIVKTKNVGPIVIMVSKTAQYDFLRELMTSAEIKAGGMHVDSLSTGILLRTVKTYTPFTDPHILIPLCVSEKDLIKFEDEWDAQYWIIVPWVFNELESWLKANSAKDCETGVCIENDFAIDSQLENAISWIKATSYPNEGFIHPLDDNRLKSMANAVASLGFNYDYYSILYYCLNNGINHDGGRKIADAFSRARTRKFKTDGNYPLSFLKEMMEEKH